MVHLWHDWLITHPESVSEGLPPIVPLVLYHGHRSWTAPRSFRDLVRVPADLEETLSIHIPNFIFSLLDLHEMPMAQVRGDIQLKAVLALLKAVSEGREIEWLEQVFAPMAHLLSQPSHLHFLRELFTYLSKCSGNVPASTFRAAIAKVKDESAKTEMMTLAEQLMAEGREEGLQKGLQQGIEQGIQKGLEQGIQRGLQEGRDSGWLLASQQAILRILERRFGAIPSDVRSHVQSLTSREQLDKALDLALSVSAASDLRF